MMSLRRHIGLIENLILVEHNVVNPTAVEAFVRKFVSRTRAEAGKAWFQKKLRSFILNDAQYLTALSADDLALMRNLPDYITQAAERGEPLFSFSAADPQQADLIGNLTQHMNHIADWFNALVTVASRKAVSQVEVEDKTIAQRWLDKLNRISMREITEIADQWFATMGSRIKTEKDGVEIMMDWPNGFYAVRYTDKATMMSDGTDLQNCLARGTYWDQVVAGTGAVYGLRKPSDEAVVGMRVSLSKAAPKLVECKGKNNKPVIAAYVPYVIQFLTKMDFDVEGVTDLKNAGIETHAGKLGTFEDIADVTYDHDGIKIWQSAARFVAAMPGRRVDGTISGNVIVNAGTDDEADDGLPDLMKILNLLKLPPSSRFSQELREQGVFYHAGRYGDASAVGERVFQIGGFTGYKVSMKDNTNTDYATVIIQTDTTPVGRMVLDSSGKLASVHGKTITPANLLPMLNALDAAPTFVCETKLGPLGIYYNGDQYGPLTAVAKPDIRVGGCTILRLGKRAMWLVSEADPIAAPLRVWMKGKKIETEAANANSDDADAAIRQLVLKYKARSMTDAQSFGMLNTKAGLVADFASFLKAAAATADLAYPEDGRHNQTEGDRHDLVRLAKRLYANKLSAEEQAKLYALFKATDVKTHTSHTDRVYDIDIPTIEITIPDGAMTLIGAEVITDKKLVTQIERDCLLALKAADATVAKHRYGYIKINPVAVTTTRLAEAVRALDDRIDAIRAATRQAINDRRANPERYATDLSSRFAAMNAFRRY